MHLEYIKHAVSESESAVSYHLIEVRVIDSASGWRRGFYRVTIELIPDALTVVFLHTRYATALGNKGVHY